MKKTAVSLPLLRLVMLPVLVVLVAVACSFSGSTPTEEPPPTDTAVPEPVSTDTPEPTSTPDLAATEAANATQAAEEVIGEIQKTVEDYEIDVDLENGYVGWVQEEPVTISLSEYGAGDYEPIWEGHEFGNFILRSNVSWDSSGWAICGFFFRSEKDFEKGDQYLFAAIRFSGLPIYWIEYWENGDFVYSPIGRGRSNKAIDLDQGATNEYILFARGGTLSAYANGTRLTNADISKRQEGEFAFVGMQESGETECKFEDTWIYVLPEEAE